MKRAREIRIVGDIAYVPLTKGREAIVDAADAHLVEGLNWHIAAGGNYAARNRPGAVKPVTILMHRVILGVADEIQVDHINGDGLDNRRANLRPATPSNNAHNAKRRSDNQSGFKGVRWHKQRCKWEARIAVGKRTKQLGLFDTPEAAHAAYCEAAVEYHGEFARVA